MGRNSSGISGSKRGASSFAKATDAMSKAFHSGNAEMKKTAIAKVKAIISKMDDDTLAARVESASLAVYLTSKEMDSNYNAKSYAYNKKLAMLYQDEAKKRKLAGYGTKKVGVTPKEQNTKVLSYASFVKTTPVLYGTITVNGKTKFGEFRSEYNPLTNKNEYRYYTLKGKRGQGGFTHDKAYSLYKSGKLKRDKNDWII